MSIGFAFGTTKNDQNGIFRFAMNFCRKYGAFIEIDPAVRLKIYFKISSPKVQNKVARTGPKQEILRSVKVLFRRFRH